jgi:formylglycine-generating enzyme required for sulfatase activity
MDEKALFDAARQLPPEAREAYLNERCADPALRARVRQLLAHSAAAGEGFIAGVLRGELEGARPALRPPEVIGGFRILESLGAGGMGVVYRAQDETLHRQIALKLLAPHLAVSEQDRARFKHEAQVAARLSHPGIVPVFHFGEDKGFLYIASELVEGESLESRLDRLREGGAGAFGRFEPRRAAALARDVADALEHAHQRGVIHRDVKPSNILLTPDDTPRLTDFGIAKVMAEEVAVTSAGAGTAHYMSPEQAAAAKATVDHRTDLFSLGVVLYEMLTGRVPFPGETREEVVEALRATEPKPPRTLAPAIPVDLQTICMKALEKSPRDRYQSAGHMAADLRSFLAGQPILARPLSPARRAMRRLYSRRTAIGMLGVGALGIGGGALWGLTARDLRARLRVLGAPSGATVSAAAYDADTDRFGPARVLGSAGATHRLEPGYWRLTVRTSDAFAECSRAVEADEEIELTPTLHPTTAVTAAMLRIEPAPAAALDALPESKTRYADQVRGLPAFWIDRTEVSNAEYQRFCDATGHPAPAMWAGLALGRDAQWANRPVVGVSFRDAQAYAEWAGKRLPTYSEWQLAARGSDGRAFPWGEDGLEDPERVRAGANAWLDQSEAMMRWDGTPAHRELYLTHTRDVEDVAGLEDTIGDGLLHMFGNVAEWTESLSLIPIPGAAVRSPHRRSIAGVGWGDSPRFRRTLSGGAEDMVQGSLVSRGFRCAKSAE